MSDKPLSSARVLAVVTNYGVEQDELVVPMERLRASGASVTVAASRREPVQTLVGDKDPGQAVTPDITLAEADPNAYDLLLIPGGTINADTLRADAAGQRLVKAFTAAGKPVAAICHGPWSLVEADVLRGRTLTSYPSLATDIRNAGAKEWLDREVVADREGGGYILITSRNPGDLDHFCAEIGHVLGETVVRTV